MHPSSSLPTPCPCFQTSILPSTYTFKTRSEMKTTRASIHQLLTPRPRSTRHFYYIFSRTFFCQLPYAYSNCWSFECERCQGSNITLPTEQSIYQLIDIPWFMYVCTPSPTYRSYQSTRTIITHTTNNDFTSLLCEGQLLNWCTPFKQGRGRAPIPQPLHSLSAYIAFRGSLSLYLITERPSLP